MLAQRKMMDEWKIKKIFGIVMALNSEFGHIPIWKLVDRFHGGGFTRKFHNDNYYCSFHTSLTFHLGPSIKNVCKFSVIWHPLPNVRNFYPSPLLIVLRVNLKCNYARRSWLYQRCTILEQSYCSNWVFKWFYLLLYLFL